MVVCRVRALLYAVSCRLIEVTSLSRITWTELITQAIVMHGIQDPIVKEIKRCTNITNEVITDIFYYERVTQF